MIRQTLGKYRIIRWLGGGQFGDVYLAQDTILELEFALKVSRMRPQDVQMLRDEARLLASLTHPNIVRFYSADQIDGQFILVSEYVKGCSLRDLIERGRLEISEALRITEKILSALAYAHSRGLVHRDLKPENVLVSDEGEVKVADFGLARFLKKGSLSASVAGTPLYMSSEAWQGRFTKESDIWSVGVILYEMLAGVLPFNGDNLDEIRSRIANDTPTPLQTLRAEIPLELGKTVQAMLAKKPENRPKEAFAVSDMLSAHGRKPEIADANGAFPERTRVEGLILTPEQRDIVQSSEKRLLLVGSVGCGKTTMLVHRARHLIEKQELPANKLLVLAFSRRAVEEIRARLERLIERTIPDAWIETFHSFCLRFLRSEGARIDLPEEFEIRSPREMKEALSKRWGANKTNYLLDKLEATKRNVSESEGSVPDLDKTAEGEDEFEEFFRNYKEELKEHDALDFNDLLLNTIRILEKYPDVREEWQKKYSFILADEFQDVDALQYWMLKHLLNPDTGLFLTADPLQSIYTWRGADPARIDRALAEFEGLKKVESVISFRITEDIRKILSNLMAHSFNTRTPSGHFHQQLEFKGNNTRNTRNTRDVPVLALAGEKGVFELYKASDTQDEARFAASKISNLIQNEGLRPSDFIILYRINSYSHAFEKALLTEKIPFTVIGSTSFHGQEEVTNVLGILRMLKSGFKAVDSSHLNWLLCLDPETNTIVAESGLAQVSPDAKTRSRNGINEYLKTLEGLSRSADEFSPGDLLDFLAESKYASKRLSQGRVAESFRELRVAASAYKRGELGLFLDRMALLEDLELAEWNSDAVKLLSAHSAKGLEAECVFMAGMIEGVFPTTRSTNSQDLLDEERRLCYVGLSRAKRNLYVTIPARRFRQATKPSRFVLEMLGIV